MFTDIKDNTFMISTCQSVKNSRTGIVQIIFVM